MKKIILLLIIASATGLKAQNNLGVGVVSGIAAGAFVSIYLTNNISDLKDYNNVTDSKSVLKRVRRDNAPWLFCGIGCAVLSVASLTNIDLGHGLSANIKGDGISIAYQIK